jgi:RimJ/RimL family protein N-acetyltransferase
MNNIFPRISDNEVNVLPFELKHLTQRYVDWLNDKEVVKYSEQRYNKHTLESCEKYFLLQKDYGNFFLAIESEDNIHIGNIGVTVDNNNKLADISILIGEKSYWGKGYALRSWNLVVDQLLNKYNYRGITAGTMSCNKPMISLMKKSHMKIESILKNRFLLDGKEIDLVIASKFSI